MSHHKHTVEAFVLTVTPVREHDARVKVVTKEGEILTAIATGLRTLKSKLRMSVVPYAHISISLVKGKDMWRLTNAHEIRSYYGQLTENASRKALARTVSLLEKLTPGETFIGTIFERLLAYAAVLVENSFENKEERLTAYETQVALQILSHLGYIENGERWNDVDVSYVEAHIKEAIHDVNHGIKSTQLV
jgi:recombinational DNA repair protein (RecF pathway)